MKNYVAMHTRYGSIYGVAVCETLGDTEKLTSFCENHGVEFTTGFVHQPEELINAVQSNLSAVTTTNKTPKLR